MLTCSGMGAKLRSYHLLHILYITGLIIYIIFCNNLLKMFPILTGTYLFVLGSLKEKCAIDLEEVRTNWISNQTPGATGCNIFIADFVDLSNNKYAKTVINLNTKITET